MAAGYEQGIRRNWRQFSLQGLMVFAVGLTLGTERTVVPLLADEAFGIGSVLVTGSFVVSFGLVKGLLNLYSGRLADTYGRKPLLVVGWLSALPIPFVLIFAPSWSWVALGNVLLGVNQGIAWSMSMIAKIELAGPDERGLAAGIDEAFGYGGVAIGGWLTGVIAARVGLRPEPFYLLLVVVVLAVLIALVLVEETLPYAQAEAATESSQGSGEATESGPSLRTILQRTTYGDRTLFAAAQAGHVENFVDTLVWIGVPLYLVSKGLTEAQIGTIVGVHSGAYILQIYTGRLGDRIGRKPPIVGGFFVAGAGMFGMTLVLGYSQWLVLSAIAGLGMALQYPNLISVVSDAADPRWRSSSLGVYRLWRDLGYAVGAVLIGLVVDLATVETAFYGTAVAMVLSGAVVVLAMEETHPEFGTHASRTDSQPSD